MQKLGFSRKILYYSSKLGAANRALPSSIRLLGQASSTTLPSGNGMATGAASGKSSVRAIGEAMR
jgi:hypothetical protein